MIYPALMYRCPGAYERPGGTYSCLSVANDDEAATAAANGWHGGLQEAIDAHDKPVALIPVDAPVDSLPVTEVALVEAAPVDDSAPIERPELESMARELGIKFDGRTSDNLLRERIEEATQ